MSTAGITHFSHTSICYFLLDKLEWNKPRKIGLGKFILLDIANGGIILLAIVETALSYLAKFFAPYIPLSFIKKERVSIWFKSSASSVVLAGIILLDRRHERFIGRTLF